MLLARPCLHQDECLVSYFIRVSELNGFKHIGHLLHHAGLGWKNNRAPIHQILTGEFELSPLLSSLGLPVCYSKINNLYAPFRRVIDTPYILNKYPKVCPDCIEELGYSKYEWALLPFLACLKHNKMLVDTHPGTGKRLGWYRQHLNRFDNDSKPIKPINTLAHSAAIELSKYAEIFLTKLEKNVSIPNVLRGLEFNESLSLIHFIVHFQTRINGEVFNLIAMENNQLGQYYQKVWNVLNNWPDSFYELLNQYIDNPMSKKGRSGIRKHYRDLYDCLHRQQKNKGIARIKVEFDYYMEIYWPGVLQPKRITRINLSSDRSIISKKEAAKILGSRPERIDKFLLMGKLSQAIFNGKTHLFREQVEALANIIDINWTMAETCESLQLTRYQLKKLLDKGIIAVIQKPDRLNRDWVIDKVQCQGMIKALRQGARKEQFKEGCVSMAGIQRQGFSITQLISSMQKGIMEYSFHAHQDYPYSIKQFEDFKLRK